MVIIILFTCRRYKRCNSFTWHKSVMSSLTRMESFYIFSHLFLFLLLVHIDKQFLKFFRVTLKCNFGILICGECMVSDSRFLLGLSLLFHLFHHRHCEEAKKFHSDFIPKSLTCWQTTVK